MFVKFRGQRVFFDYDEVYFYSELPRATILCMFYSVMKTLVKMR